MSTSENESANIDLKHEKKINGWWRLWIVVSIIWFFICLPFMVFSFINGENGKPIARHYLILKSLSKNQQELIVSRIENKNDFKTQPEKFQNGETIYFKLPLSKEQINEWSQNYIENGKKIQKNVVIKNLFAYMLTIITPPIIILSLGFGVAWIKSGFKTSSK